MRIETRFRVKRQNPDENKIIKFIKEYNQLEEVYLHILNINVTFNNLEDSNSNKVQHLINGKNKANSQKEHWYQSSQEASRTESSSEDSNHNWGREEATQVQARNSSSERNQEVSEMRRSSNQKATILKIGQRNCI